MTFKNKYFNRLLSSSFLLFALLTPRPILAQELPTPDPRINELEQKQKELLEKEQEILKQSLKDVSQEQNQTSKQISGKKIKKPSTSNTPVIPSTANTPETTPTLDPLQQAQFTIAKLKKELDETKNRLALSETEVERLALLIDNRQKLQPNNKSQTSFNSKNPSGYNQALRVREPSEIQAKVDGDMQIATVIAEKAQLRTGPGLTNSPLMTVGQGTRLAIETQKGEWFRVIAPSGARAWVSADVLDIGRNKNTNNPISSTNNESDNGGFPTDAEVEAFKALQFNNKNSK
jgi:hypothetical protein